GDFVDPLFDIYFHAGYKRYLGSHVNLNFTYHKFNLAYKDQFNNGFMSFDLNLEWNVLPFDSFSPFIYAGGGLNAANYFTRTDSKVQGGAGIEYLVSKGVGVKLYTDYNHVFTDELDGKIYGDAEDIYWRLGFGLNLYFGKHGRSNRITKNGPTVIESNPIVDDY
ncbi:MAG: Curli production assembly/transport component CsgG, partial [Flavobacteriaceae bacterium]|nr:Curli production assembly/transport component CsgG [Flavobacteriaceae bacterium]